MVEEHQEFKPIAPNPFYTGAPVRDPARFFGREDDFAYARKRLGTETEGIVLLFVGERRSGKTSILFQILNGRLGEGFLPIFVDMQEMAGLKGDRDFLSRLAEITREAIKDPRLVPDYYDFSQGNPILVFDQLLGDIQKIVARRLVLLVDEAEILREKVARGEISGAVLLYLASILEKRQVSYCFTGSPGLRESDVEEWRRLLAKGDYKEISFLSRDDTMRLIRNPVEGRVTYGEGVPGAIYGLTLGHPFYTQVVCTNIVDYLNEVRRNTVAVEDLDTVLRTIMENPPPQLLYAWDELNPGEQIALSLLSEESPGAQAPLTPETLFSTIKKNSYPLVDLKTDGLHIALESLYERKVVDRTPDGAFWVRVDLFRQWIRQARSIWRLVEEAKPPERSRPWPWLAAAAVLVVALGLAFWLVQPPRAAQFEMGEPGGAPVAGTVGKVLVLGTPEDTEVWIGGRLRARDLPATLDSLPPGPLRVELRHSKYYAQILEVKVRAGDVIETPRFALKRLTGTLAVKAQLPGTQIEIRGEQNFTGAAPLTKSDLPTGTYEVVARAAGYKEQVRSVEVAEGSAATLEFGLKADVGRAFLASVPPGAQIWLDGKDQGLKTPTRLDAVPVGKHKLELRLDHYLPADLELTIRFDQADSLQIPLILRPARLSLQSDPDGAEVFLDQDPVAWARTPTSQKELPAGTHTLRITYPGHKEFTQEIAVGPGEDFSRSFPLEPYKGILRIIGSSGSVVNLQTKAVTEVEANTDFELPVGKYQIRTKDGKDTIVEVVQDQRKNVKLK